MKKNKVKKLHLNRETLQGLDQDLRIAGGAVTFVNGVCEVDPGSLLSKCWASRCICK